MSPSHSSRQGPPARLQGKTRILHYRSRVSHGGRKRAQFPRYICNASSSLCLPHFPIKSTVSERTDGSDAWANHQQLPQPKINRASVMASRSIKALKKLKFARNLRSVAEERAARRCGALRVLNSYWLNEVKSKD